VSCFERYTCAHELAEGDHHIGIAEASKQLGESHSGIPLGVGQDSGLLCGAGEDRVGDPTGLALELGVSLGEQLLAPIIKRIRGVLEGGAVGVRAVI